MTIPAWAISQFYRCGELYRLTQIEGVPRPPNTSQVVARSVREAVQRELASKTMTGSLLSLPEAHSAIEAIVRSQMTSTVDLTEEQAHMGQRRVFEGMLFSVTRLMTVWRALVGQKADPVMLSPVRTIETGNHLVSASCEYRGRDGTIRFTKIRSRKPEIGDASRNLVVLSAGLAFGVNQAVVDYLIDTKELGYVKQVVEFEPGMLAAAEERLKLAVDLIDRGVFIPTDSQAWWCQSCRQRMMCRYVA